MSWYTATTGNTWRRHPEPEFVDSRDFRTVQKCDYAPMSVETLESQVYRMVAENLKVFVRELTEKIENGTLVFNEKEMEDRIEKLFCDQM